MNKNLIATLLLALLMGCQSNPLEQAEFAFVGANVIDVETGSITENQVVLIGQGEIIAVAHFDETILPTNLETVFAKGQYLMPGLMDSHVHAFSDPPQAIEKTLPLFIANGVTYIRDMGSTLDNIDAVNTQLSADPKLIAPYFITTGPLIDGKKLSWYRDLQTVVQTEDDIPAVLDSLEQAGIQDVKIYSNLAPEIYSAITEQAELRSMRIVGHLPAGVTIKAAAKHGQLTIEHLDISSTVSCASVSQPWLSQSINARFQQGYDHYFQLMSQYWQQLDWVDCADDWSLFATSGGYLTPTLVMETSDSSLVEEEALDYLAPEARTWCERGLQDIAASEPERQHSAYSGLKSALDQIRGAKVPLLAGSDTPNHCLVSGYSLHWELARMIDFGLSPLEAIQTATLNPAIAFTGKPRTVAAGQSATLILLQANPLEHIGALQQLVGVYSHRQWHDAKALVEIKRKALQYAPQTQ